MGSVLTSTISELIVRFYSSVFWRSVSTLSTLILYWIVREYSQYFDTYSHHVFNGCGLFSSQHHQSHSNPSSLSYTQDIITFKNRILCSNKFCTFQAISKFILKLFPKMASFWSIYCKKHIIRNINSLTMCLRSIDNSRETSKHKNCSFLLSVFCRIL